MSKTNKIALLKNHVTLSISQVERDTGLSKDTLRMWERRYGFPQPDRDALGERVYDGPQLDKLRVIKRLMDAGHRPGKLMDKSFPELSKLGVRRITHGLDDHLPAARTELMRLLQAHDAVSLEKHFAQLLLRQGLLQFVLATVAPFNAAVGEAWLRGELAIYEEHLYTERIQSVLRVAIQSLPRDESSPRILLTTLPQEQHILGLLMVEALLAIEGVPCISLGTQTPATEIASAAAAHRVDIVALSFSAGFPVRGAAAGIATLRETLPRSSSMWVGGQMSSRLKNLPDGVRRIRSLDDVLPALSDWRVAALNHSSPG